MKFRSKCRIGIRALLVNEHTHVGWQPSGFIQQVRSRTRVGRYNPFQDLSQGDGGRIKREIDQRLIDDDTRRAIDRDTYMHGSPSLNEHAQQLCPCFERLEHNYRETVSSYYKPYCWRT